MLVMAAATAAIGMMAAPPSARVNVRTADDMQEKKRREKEKHRIHSGDIRQKKKYRIKGCRP